MTASGGSQDESEPAEATCHATCLVLGEDGILIRGPAGSGKSTLCLDLLDHADAAGLHGRLVGDDRICLSRRYGRIVARPHPALKGLIEIRGLGIRRLTRSAEGAVICLVADLVKERPRLPAEGPDETALLGLRLPLVVLARDQPRAYLVRQALAAMRQSRSLPSVASRTHFAAQWTAEPRDL